MGVTCSKCGGDSVEGGVIPTRHESPDPEIFDIQRESVRMTQSSKCEVGQHHLLFKAQKQKQQQSKLGHKRNEDKERHYFPSRTIVRKRPPKNCEEGRSGTHVYVVRYPEGSLSGQEEQAPAKSQRAAEDVTPSKNVVQTAETLSEDAAMSPRIQSSGKENICVSNGQRASSMVESIQSGNVIPVDAIFRPSVMATEPRQKVVDWVTISKDHNIYIADVGLTSEQCDQIISVTEFVCRGQYAAYTYAKQTLGCREFPILADVCQPPVHTMSHYIMHHFSNFRISLDDREPHMVKYDTSRRERQKLDMHTDKSEWTFLISLSNSAGVDFDGGGTYFECIDATVHLQRGHALVFPGRLRHCGQRITSGLRFLLVGFLVDKSKGSEGASSSSKPVSHQAAVTSG